MSTLEQLRRGLGRAWDNITEGWQQLAERATHALTRFNPAQHGGELETVDEQLARSAVRWGLLAAEVEERDEDIVVRLEAPGMDPQDFDVSVVDNYLLVRGEKRVQREQKPGHYHMMECAYGSFERAVPLPAPVLADRTRAKYRRGVLNITLTKAEPARRRRIKVEVG